ncbi:hypothetical protein D3C80_2206300 [compost metagenome]
MIPHKIQKVLSVLRNLAETAIDDEGLSDHALGKQTAELGQVDGTALRAQR